MQTTAVQVRGVGAVPEVVAAGCYQGGLNRSGPLVVSLGQPPHLIGGQAEITEHGPERLAAVDRIEELSPQVDR